MENLGPDTNRFMINHHARVYFLEDWPIKDDRAAEISNGKVLPSSSHFQSACSLLMFLAIASNLSNTLMCEFDFVEFKELYMVDEEFKHAADGLLMRAIKSSRTSPCPDLPDLMSALSDPEGFKRRLDSSTLLQGM